MEYKDLYQRIGRLNGNPNLRTPETIRRLSKEMGWHSNDGGLFWHYVSTSRYKLVVGEHQLLCVDSPFGLSPTRMTEKEIDECQRYLDEIESVVGVSGAVF